MSLIIILVGDGQGKFGQRGEVQCSVQL